MLTTPALARLRALLLAAKHTAPQADDFVAIDLNPRESVAIPGCRYIYAPGGRANEYAPLTAYPYRGCGHKCGYCYVPLFLRMLRSIFDAGAVNRPDFIAHLRQDAAKYQAAGITEQVLLSFLTDLYNPNNMSLSRPTIETLIEFGLSFCVLTKGGSRSMADIDLYRRDRDAYACTLTSLAELFSRKWERDAAMPSDRISALKTCFNRGIYTWVSLEPVLNAQSSLKIVEETHEFVNLFKIGKLNYNKSTIDWREYTLRMIDLCQRLNVAHYIKHDLQPYLPAGYINVMRVQQHH